VHRLDSQQPQNSDLLNWCQIFILHFELRLMGVFYDKAVIRPLRTATRRSWQPGGFGDSCLPDGIFHGALDYRFVEVMPTPDAVSRSM